MEKIENSSEAPPALEVEDLHHSFGHAAVLRDLDLIVAPGEYCVVLGKSGGGKSTLLHVIAGLLSHAAGTTAINGIDVGAIAPKDRDVALLFQDDRLYPHWTLRRTLELADRRSPLFDPLEETVISIADRFEISDVLDRRPDQVSGGQLRRAALAKAVLRRPAIALLDEPLHGLDAGLREDFIEMLANFPSHRGDRLPSTAILHVTHDGDEAMRLGDQIAVLNEGKIVQKDSPEIIYHRPRSLAVADAIGQPPANRMRADQFFEIATNTDELGTSRSQELNADGWVLIRPENIAVEHTRSHSVTSNRVTWNARLVSTCFVAGHWLSRWSSGSHAWVSTTASEPESTQGEAALAILSVAWEDLIWVN